MHEGIEFIGNGCFFCCRRLKEFYMPNSIIGTGKEILLGCRSLERVTFSSKLEKIEVGLLSRCRKLKKIYLPFKVGTVCNGAFAECSGLECFEYENPNIVMGVKVFDGCTSLLANEEFKKRMATFLANNIGRK